MEYKLPYVLELIYKKLDIGNSEDIKTAGAVLYHHYKKAGFEAFVQLLKIAPLSKQVAFEILEEIRNIKPIQLDDFIKLCEVAEKSYPLETPKIPNAEQLKTTIDNSYNEFINTPAIDGKQKIANDIIKFSENLNWADLGKEYQLKFVALMRAHLGLIYD